MVSIDLLTLRHQADPEDVRLPLDDDRSLEDRSGLPKDRDTNA